MNFFSFDFYFFEFIISSIFITDKIVGDIDRQVKDYFSEIKATPASLSSTPMFPTFHGYSGTT